MKHFISGVIPRVPKDFKQGTSIRSFCEDCEEIRKPNPVKINPDQNKADRGNEIMELGQIKPGSA